MSLTNLRLPKIGADPELAFLYNGRLINLNDYLKVGERFGKDENKYIGELHPKPSENPIEIIKDLKKIMQDAVNKNPDFYDWTWKANSACKGQVCGGHIHFSIPKGIISPEDACSQFLDHYLGAITLLLEDRKEGLARRKYNKTPMGQIVNYGHASDWRIKKWGMEYRTPSTWLGNAYVASAILHLAQVIAYEFLNNRSKFKFSYYVNSEDFIEMNTTKIRTVFPSIWRDIVKMELYPYYRKQLEIIPFLIKNQLTWHPKGLDVKASWGIINPRFKNPNVMTLDTIWKDFEKQKNIWRVIEEPVRQNPPEPVLGFKDFHKRIERIQNVKWCDIEEIKNYVLPKEEEFQW